MGFVDASAGAVGDATGPSRHGGVYAAVDDEIGDAGRDSILAELDPEGIAQDPYRMGDEDWAKLRKLYSDVMTIRGARLAGTFETPCT